jgi:hypothetical protein
MPVGLNENRRHRRPWWLRRRDALRSRELERSLRDPCSANAGWDGSGAHHLFGGGCRHMVEEQRGIPRLVRLRVLFVKLMV